MNRSESNQILKNQLNLAEDNISDLIDALSTWDFLTDGDGRFDLAHYVETRITDSYPIEEVIGDLKLPVARKVIQSYDAVLREYLENDIVAKRFIMETDQYEWNVPVEFDELGERQWQYKRPPSIFDKGPWSMYNDLISRINVIKKLVGGTADAI